MTPYSPILNQFPCFNIRHFYLWLWIKSHSHLFSQVPSVRQLFMDLRLLSYERSCFPSNARPQRWIGKWSWDSSLNENVLIYCGTLCPDLWPCSVLCKDKYLPRGTTQVYNTHQIIWINILPFLTADWAASHLYNTSIHFIFPFKEIGCPYITCEIHLIHSSSIFLQLILNSLVLPKKQEVERWNFSGDKKDVWYISLQIQAKLFHFLIVKSLTPALYLRNL